MIGTSRPTLDGAKWRQRWARACSCNRSRSWGAVATGATVSAVPRRALPGAPVGDVEGDDRPGRRLAPVLRVLLGEEGEGGAALVAVLQHPGAAAQPHPPQRGPVLLVVVHQHRGPAALPDVAQPPQVARAL